MTVLWAWTGAPTHDTIRIKARVSGTSARIGVSTTESISSPTWHGPYAASDRGIIDATISGLPSGTRHWYVVEDRGSQALILDGSSAFARTPDAAALDITGDIDMRADIVMTAWPPSSERRLIAKYATTGNQRSYNLSINSVGQLRVNWSPDGTAVLTRTSTVAVPIAIGDRIGVRATIDVDNGASGHTVTFYTSTDWSTWTQLGSPVVTAGTTSIFSGTGVLAVGARDTPAADYLPGNIYRAEVRSGINGTVVAAPNFQGGAVDGWLPGDTAATAARNDSAGRPWSLIGGANIQASSAVVDYTWKGRFRTWDGPSGTQVSQTIAAWTCAGNSPRFPGAAPYTSNHPVLDRITDLQPDILVQGGDLHYANIGTNSVSRYRDAYDAVLNRAGTPRLSRHLAMNPNFYLWDDHDFGPNDSDGTNPGRPAAAATYREYVPHDPLPDGDAGIYHARQIGRVLHVFSDVRYYRDPNGASDTPSKTMLGAEQKDWFDNLLATTDAEFLVWYMPSQWMGISEDSWSSFTYERNELVNILRAPGGDSSKDWTGRMCQVSGDVHAIAQDDGSGNKWGGFPVYVWASVDSSGSNMQGDIYMQNGRYVPSSPGRGRYGVLRITDNGDSIDIDASAYIGSWRKFHHQWTVNLVQEAEMQEFSASEIEAVVEVDWSSGTYFGTTDNVPSGFQLQDVDGFTVTRELATDIPDEVRLSTGLSAAESGTNVLAPPGETLGAWSPWRTTRKYLRAPYRASIYADGTRYPQFVGSTDAVGSDREGVRLKVSSLDGMSELNRPVDLPAFAGRMAPGYNPGIQPAWVIEHVLSQFGRGSLWPEGPNNIYYQSLAGSTMTSNGGWEYSLDPQGPNDPPRQVPASDMPYDVLSYHGSMLTGSESDEVGTSSIDGWTFGAISGAPADPMEDPSGAVGVASSDFRFQLAVSPDDNSWDRWLRVRHRSDPAHSYLTVDWRDIQGTVFGSVVFDDIQLGPWWISVQPTGATEWTVSLMQPGEPVRTSPMSSDQTILNTDLIVKYTSVVGRGSATMGAQVLRGAYTLDQLPEYDPDSARITAPVSTIVGVPALDNPTAASVLQDIASAEQGAFWFDEDGIPTFESREQLRGLGKTSIPVRAETSLIDAGSWTTTTDQIRSRVEVPLTVPVVSVNPDGWQQVWDADSIVTVYGGETLDLLIDLDTPIGGVAGTLWPSGVTGGCWFRGNRAIDGSGSFIAVNRANAGRVIQVSATRVRVIWTNRYSYPVHFVNADGEPEFHIGARWTIADGDTVTVVKDTGEEGTVLTLPDNPWRQDRQSAASLAAWTIGEVSAPRPFLTDLKVAFDPRIKLGSIVDLRDPDLYGVEVRCLVRGVDIDSGPGYVTQTLSVQPLRLTLGEVDAAHAGWTLGEVDEYWVGRTLGDQDNNPLEGTRLCRSHQAGSIGPALTSRSRPVPPATAGTFS